mmetsp:Transcript_71665/g.149811  ORF Transcript_71665/g.149811 Transcript_71665/m.149811 type:complete len:131 (-) Transcript_71665:299-691(-)
MVLAEVAVVAIDTGEGARMQWGVVMGWPPKVPVLSAFAPHLAPPPKEEVVLVVVCSRPPAAAEEEKEQSAAAAAAVGAELECIRAGRERALWEALLGDAGAETVLTSLGGPATHCTGFGGCWNVGWWCCC